jgi:hypothetical protein
MVDKNSANVFLDHYKSVLGDPIDVHAYASESLKTPFYIAQHVGYAPNTQLLLTAGVSAFADELGTPLEVVLYVDDAVDEVEDFLFAAIHFAITQRLHIEAGFSLQGLSTTNPKLAKRSKKEAIYFTSLKGAPPQLDNIPTEVDNVILLTGILISAEENEFFLNNGADAFEEKLGIITMIDPKIKRKSVL